MSDRLQEQTAGKHGILQDPDFNSVGNDTGHTVGYDNRVLNDGTYSNVVNGEGPERTGR